MTPRKLHSRQGHAHNEVVQNNPKTIMTVRQSKPRPSFADRSKRPNPRAGRPPFPQNARKNYERYLALAEDEVRIGNTVAAENYYQYAEHYYRLIHSDPETT